MVILRAYLWFVRGNPQNRQNGNQDTQSNQGNGNNERIKADQNPNLG